MVIKTMPTIFLQLETEGCINASDVLSTQDGFFLVYKSLSDILAEKNIFDFLDADGERLECHRFFDDWFLYAVPGEADHTYSLFKMREQEYDAQNGTPADGDTPGVTISFISFDYGILLDCLANPTRANRARLNEEINRVVAYKGQRHHKALKKYFVNPNAEGAYLVASLYTGHIARFVEEGRLPVPEHYKEILQQSISYKKSASLARLPHFIEELNRQAGRVVCDGEYIYFSSQQPTEEEKLAILATHTGNTSVYSFAAEVEFHARFLIPAAKIKIPFFAKSIYASAIRADMSVGDAEAQGPAPFYRADSKIVKRQYALHAGRTL